MPIVITSRRKKNSVANLFIVLGMCLAIAAVGTLGDQALHWITQGEWPNLIIGDVWMMSGLRALPVESDKTQAFIDFLLDVPLSEGCFALAGVMVCLGGVLFVRNSA
jgi:hypothetical protein